MIFVILPKAPVERLIRKAGGERVSDDAAVKLAAVLEKIGLEISEHATKLSHHAGRKTVVLEDIELAAEEWTQKR